MRGKGDREQRVRKRKEGVGEGRQRAESEKEERGVEGQRAESEKENKRQEQEGERCMFLCLRYAVKQTLDGWSQKKKLMSSGRTSSSTWAWLSHK